MKIKLLSLLVLLLFCSSVSFADAPRFHGEMIVVTALRIPRLKSTIPWNTKLITRKDIEESAAVKVGDILRTVSGLSVKSTGGLAAQIAARFRGSNSQQVLVLLNGNRINSPTLGTFDLGDILLTDVEKIEVVKAPLSAIYGADAVGGVVNVITRKATKEPKLNVSLAYGEYATRNYSVSGSGPNYFFSVAELKSNGFRANSDYRAYDYNVRFSGEMGPAYLEAGIKKYDAVKGSPGSLDFLTPQARQDDNNLFYDLTYRAPAIGLKATISRTSLNQRYSNPAFALLTTTETTTTNLNIDQIIEWFPAQTMLIGLEIRSDQSSGSSAGNRELRNKAVYFQDEIDLGVAKVVVGGREDINSAYGNRLNPRIGCVFNPLNDIFLKVSWGTSFKAPTINDLFWSRTTEPSWSGGLVTTEGNANLVPETSAGFNITLEREIDANSRAAVSLYQNEINDMIRWTNTSSSLTDAFYTPVNINNASIQGLEFEYESQIHDGLQGFVNLTCLAAKDSATDNYLDYAPQTQYNAGLTHRNGSGLTTNVVVKHVGQRYTNLANTNQLSSYTVVDLAFSKDCGPWGVKLDIENLFNENYAESYGFSDVYPMPGRRYNIGVRREI